MSEPAQEWSAPLVVPALQGMEMVHARFVTHVFPLHAHAEFVIGAVATGAKRSRVGRRSVIARPGRLTLFNPFEEHESAGISQSWTYTALYPTPALVKKYFGDSPVRFRGPLVEDIAGARMIRRLYRMLRHRVSKLDAEIAFVETMNHLIGAHGGNTPCEAIPSGAGMRRVREHLDRGAELNLVDLADCAGLPVASFLRGFRRAFGCTPRVYCTARRIASAKRALQSGVSLASVAADFAFCDQSHFTRVFHRWTGATPGAFRTACV